MTGLKHYLGPFEAYGEGTLPETPFVETEPRLDAPNFYYAQEDELFAAAGRHRFSWSVHRAHTVVGYAVGNAMNIASTLAVYAALCRETGRTFTFPGSEQQWHGLTDMTDAGPGRRPHDLGVRVPVRARPGAQRRRRRRLPLALDVAAAGRAADVKAEGFDGTPRPLEEQTAGMDDVWERIAEREGLREPRLDRWPRSGTPTATSAATSSASPT